MPEPARPPLSPPPSRWIVPTVVLIVVVLGAVTFFLLRRPGGSTAGPAIPGAPESSPDATASVLAETPAEPPDNRFQPPRILTSRPVTYPEQALLNRVEGVVRVKFSVDDSGHLANPPVVDKSSGSVMLDAMVLEYDLKQWTFQPATFDGKPVPGTLEKEFEFRLDPREQRALAAERLDAPVGTPDAPYPKDALALKPQGTCTIAVTWTTAGLVDTINLAQSSGSNALDRAALRFAFTHWRIDPKATAAKEFTKKMTFTPPLGANDTPPPL